MNGILIHWFYQIHTNTKNNTHTLNWKKIENQSFTNRAQSDYHHMHMNVLKKYDFKETKSFL